LDRGPDRPVLGTARGAELVTPRREAEPGPAGAMELEAGPSVEHAVNGPGRDGELPSLRLERQAGGQREPGPLLRDLDLDFAFGSAEVEAGHGHGPPLAGLEVEDRERGRPLGVVGVDEPAAVRRYRWPVLVRLAVGQLLEESRALERHLPEVFVRAAQVAREDDSPP